MSVKDWVITLNNYSQEEYDSIVKEMKEACCYFIIGKEKAPSSLTPHLQGFFQLKKKQSLKRVKQQFSARAHFEKRSRNSTPLQASDYCKKDGDFLEFGVISSAGKRNDMLAVKEVLAKGGMREVVEQGFNMQAIRFAEKYLQYKETKRDWEPLVIWVYGPTGLGKSRLARTICGSGDNLYCKNESSKWWNGYDAHPYVILDDFDDSWMTYQELLSLLDRYERTVEFKGGSRQFLARRTVITSQWEPQRYYSAKGDISQLLRRITKIIHLHEHGQWKTELENLDLEEKQEEQKEALSSEPDNSDDETDEEELKQKTKRYRKEQREKLTIVNIED